MPSRLDTVKIIPHPTAMDDTPHHHGNLREALIVAGTQLLNEGGIAGLTLRRAAARAGVSHAAPAHHFAGLPGLLTAIATRAFQQFCTTLKTTRDASPPDPMSRLIGTTAGYLAFAQDHVGLFHLMFLSTEVDRSDPDLAKAAAYAYQLLRDACLPFSATGAPDETLEIAVWSMVHGYALLEFTRPPQHRRPIAHTPEFAALLSRLLDGHAKPLAPTPDLR